MSKENITVKREDIADAIFDALSLYCVENEVYEALKGLTAEKLKPVQDEVEKLLKAIVVNVEIS